MTDKQLMIPNLEETKALALVSQMDLLLDQAEDWDAMLNVRNGTLGIAAMAGAMGMTDVAQKAKIVQLKAERKAGGWLIQYGPRKGGIGGGATSPDGRSRLTMEDLGINWHKSSMWQNMAKVPDRQFSRWVDGCLKDDEEVTRSAFIRFIRPRKEKPVERALTLVDRMILLVQEFSKILHAIGKVKTPAEAKSHLAWARQAKAEVQAMLRGLDELIVHLQKEAK